MIIFQAISSSYVQKGYTFGIIRGHTGTFERLKEINDHLNIFEVKV